MAEGSRRMPRGGEGGLHDEEAFMRFLLFEGQTRLPAERYRLRRQGWMRLV